MTNSQSKIDNIDNVDNVDNVVNVVIKPKRAKPDKTKPSIKRNKKCQCTRAVHPSYGIPGENIAKCCSECKTDEMTNLVNRKCQCGKKSPTYNIPGLTDAICCKDCKPEFMVNVKDKHCMCGKALPIYALPGTTTAICCKSCMKDDMIDVKNKNKMCMCGKARATFNNPGETKAKYCNACKIGDMVNVIDKKCRCGKSQANFGLESELKYVCCIECKTPDMIDVRNRNKMCVVCKTVRASYNIEGADKAEFCLACKSDIMINVNDIQCIGIDGKCPLGQYSNEKYDGYCSSCFTHKFPNDPRVQLMRKKTKELAVRDFINNNFEGFTHDSVLWTGHCDCTIRRRIDHRKLIGNTLLAIETDENQHKRYNEMDEETRYDDLYMAFSGKWIYIRFNPDGFKNNCNISKNPNMEKRLEILKKEIEKQIKKIENDENTELVERVYLFYDGYDFKK